MSKLPSYYAYPAIFKTDGDGWEASFPDLDNAYTAADTLEQAILETQAVLEECLYFREAARDEIPVPTHIEEIAKRDGEHVQIVVASMAETRREMSQRAVKKTLTIPFWMEEELKKRPTLNVSAILQKAISQELNIHSPTVSI